jgi:hypothetical protein
MRKLLLGATLLSGLAALASPANARLQLSINANGSTFSCFDGQLGCDQSGGANNLLAVNTTIGGAFVEIALATSTFGRPDILELSSSKILNVSGKPITINLLASDTNFTPPVSFIESSASLTFNEAVGSGPSSLSFYADKANVQGANLLNTPGTLLEMVSGTPTTDPDSFSGSRLTAFSASAPFSMTETASLALIKGGSITGFNQSMTSGIPEPRTWAMLILGFGMMAFMGARKVRKDRLGALA